MPDDFKGTVCEKNLIGYYILPAVCICGEYAKRRKSIKIEHISVNSRKHENTFKSSLNVLDRLEPSHATVPLNQQWWGMSLYKKRKKFHEFDWNAKYLSERCMMARTRWPGWWTWSAIPSTIHSRSSSFNSWTLAGASPGITKSFPILYCSLSNSAPYYLLLSTLKIAFAP